MKSSILHLLSLSLILSFSVSCGKKSDGGGSSNQNANNYIIPNGGVATGETAYNNLKAWYDKSDDTPVGMHAFYLKKDFNQMIIVAPVMCQPGLIGIPLCAAPSGCFKHTTNAIVKGVVEMEGSDNRRYKDCNINGVGATFYQKSLDQNLKDAVLGKSGRYLIKSLTQQTGGIFTVAYGSFEGSTQPVTYAKINATLPAIVNPVEEGTVGSNSKTLLVDFRTR
jgi:hypothetical protein